MGEAYGSTPTEIDSFLGSSNLARITFTVDAHRGRRAQPRPRVGAGRRPHDVVGRPAAGVRRRSARRDGGATPADARRRRRARVVPLGRARRRCGRRHRCACSTWSTSGDVDAHGSDPSRRRPRGRLAHAGLPPRRPDRPRRTAADARPRRPAGARGAAVPARDRRPGVLTSTTSACACRRASSSTTAATPTCGPRSRACSPGDIEPDGFNRLVLIAGLTAAQANVLRCYAKYAQPDRVHVQPALHRGHARAAARISRRCSSSCSRRASTRRLDEGDRIAALAVADAEVLAALDAVPSLDEDRIGRMFLVADPRHGAHQRVPGPADGRLQVRPRRSCPTCPAPRPQHEIFVCSSRVEGVHLRGGADRAWRAALERSPRGLPHRGARPGQGADGEERGDRAGRCQGWLRRQAAEADAGREPRRRRRVLPACSCAACST